jgi:pimeloyl-ACP methyl ester carboxylesterase
VRAAQCGALPQASAVSPPPTLLDTEALRAFGGPVLVTVGEADDLAPPRMLSDFIDGNPGVRLEVIPETDHFFLTGLAELGRIAREWLSR